MTPLLPLHEMLTSLWNKNNYMCLLQPYSISFCQWVDVLFTKNDICTLADIVIIDPMRTDLLPRSCATQGFVASDTTQVKERNYHNWHPTDQFFPLAIKVFGCLHKHVDVFLHDCANAIWSLKVQKALIFLPWSPFFVKKFRSHYEGCKRLPS
jgi:hypothetical protein